MLFSSALLFAYHCGQGQLGLAGLQPPLIYSALLLLFLPLPLKVLFPVRAHADLYHFHARHPRCCSCVHQYACQGCVGRLSVLEGSFVRDI